MFINPITHNRKVEENMKCNEPRTTCPSREEFAKELFNSLGGCVIKETTGYTIYDRWVMKFGKDNNEFGHSGDKTVSSYPEDSQQPPKERKVSLEEIRQTIRQHGGWESSIDDISKAILSLINATEEQKGSDELDKAKDHIMFLLPMAKGYAYPKNIKANLEMIKNAEEFIKPNIN